MKHLPRISAVIFMLWGIIHILGGAGMVASLSDGPTAYLDMIASGPASQGLSAAMVLPGEIVNVMGYHGFNLALLGAVAVFTGVGQWKGSRLAFWTSVTLVGLVDAGLAIYMILPGYMTWGTASPGLFLFVLGTATGLAGLVVTAPAATNRAT